MANLFTTLSTAAAAVDEATKSEKVDIISLIQSSSLEDIKTLVLTHAIDFITNILLAVVVYLIGRWIIKRIASVVRHIFDRQEVDISLARFIISMISITLNALLIFTVIGILGINTSSFLAIFASAGLAIGMALSGMLQNFAGGVMILFLKPYKVGDWIEAQGYTGGVKEISLFSTLLNTIDNKAVIIPNGSLSTGIINNYSRESTRRVDWTISVAYGSDYDKVERVLLDIINSNPLVLQDKDRFVAISSLASSSVDFALRGWTATDNYWPLYHGILKEVYQRFYRENIEFPFPQLDVNLKNQK